MLPTFYTRRAMFADLVDACQFANDVALAGNDEAYRQLQIKVTEQSKNTITMSIKEFIEKQLQKRAQEEPQFALKLQNKSKSIDQCIKYIYGEVLNKYVKEHRGAQAAAVERDELVSMAVHYYDEDDIKIRPLSGVAVRTAGNVKSTSNSRAKKSNRETVKTDVKVAENTPKREAKQPKPKVAKKTVIDEAFVGSLFDASMFE